MADTAPVTDRCSCGLPPQRLCDVRYSTERVHLACSVACLGRHQRALHPAEAELDAPARATRFAGSVNGRFPDNWQRYQSQ